MKCFLHALVFLSFILAAEAQAGWPIPGAPGNVPMPPPPPVRTMAEWEEVQAIVITWDPDYTQILKEVVRHSQAECRVLIITTQPAVLEAFLRSENVPMENVGFIEADFNSV